MRARRTALLPALRCTRRTFEPTSVIGDPSPVRTAGQPARGVGTTGTLAVACSAANCNDEHPVDTNDGHCSTPNNEIARRAQ